MRVSSRAMADYDLSGKVILITGATDGLGQAVAVDAATAGATVLVHGRSPERIKATLELVGSASIGEPPRAYQADLASLTEVRGLARAVAEGEQRLDVLVNNAGIGGNTPGGGERQESVDGHELRFAVNYLAGYLLTRALIPLLQASAPARIVNVSSAGQMPLDFDDVMLEHDYSGTRAYCQSKLAQILFTFDLAGELAGSGVTATCLHPSTYMPTKMVQEPISTLDQGVEATMRLIADPALDDVSGRYFNVLEDARPDPQARDPDARRRLRELSELLAAAAA
jgi:NAD(P)-dependent dehydrogenase (short-subunit alcohol dehydrogenase family)